MKETGDMLRKHCCVFYGLDGTVLDKGWSVGQLVGRLVGQSVGQSVRSSVGW